MLRWLLRLLGGSTQLLTGSQTKSFFCSRRSLELLAQNIPDDQHDTKMQLSFDVCYIIESVRGLIELLYRATASQKLVPSTRHRERSILAVQSHLPFKCLRKHKNDGCTHMRTPPYCGTVWKRKHFHPKTIVRQNWTLTFYWPLLYCSYSKVDQQYYDHVQEPKSGLLNTAIRQIKISQYFCFH